MSEKPKINRFDTRSDDPDIQPRLSPRTRNQLTAEHRAIHDGIVESVRQVNEMSNGALPGPFNAWMYLSPSLTQALDTLGVAIRTETAEVSIVLKEIAVCVVAAHRRCNVAFWAHSAIALRAGLSAEVLHDLKNRRTPAFEDLPGVSAADQSTVHRFVRSYLDEHRVSDDLYDELRQILGSDRAMVELVVVIGHYCTIAAQLNLLRVPAPGDEQPFLKPDDPNF